MSIKDNFMPAAAQTNEDMPVERQRSPEAVRFNQQYDTLFTTLRALSKKAKSLDDIEPEIRQAFKDFLIGMQYPMALKNFESLLHEKHGRNFRRLDGTVNWFHEFIPLMTHFAIFRMGNNKNIINPEDLAESDDTGGGIDLEDLAESGGMEVFIASTLRHDSTEDHTKPMQFRRMQLRKLNEVRREYPEYDAEDAGRAFVENMLHNNRLISQQYTMGPKGEKIKEDVVEYSYRMVTDPRATPQVFIQKQGDINHNFSTFFGAPRFTAEKRLKRCNEREDMYGRRYGFTDIAIEKWPKFENGIKILDSIMGMQLYPHFRYLQKVDLHYKKPYDIPVGIKPYVQRALSLELPDEKFNMIHIGMRRMMASVNPVTEPEKYARLQEHIEKTIKPAIERYKDHFPYLFQRPGNNPHPAPSPVA